GGDVGGGGPVEQRGGKAMVAKIDEKIVMGEVDLSRRLLRDDLLFDLGKAPQVPLATRDRLDFVDTGAGPAEILLDGKLAVAPALESRPKTPFAVGMPPKQEGRPLVEKLPLRTKPLAGPQLVAQVGKGSRKVVPGIEVDGAHGGLLLE